MELTPFQIDILRALLRTRMDHDGQFVTQNDLAALAGHPGKEKKLGGAMEDLATWCREHGLPDLTAVVIPQENADENLMLPDEATIERLGGRAVAQAEAARVRDFDWAGWRDS
ncbi:hypothetical protein KTN05_01090 [Paracoccus sp. Z118]|uniref:hypothetical protein n=1 Tax=Paracoccus sp. Z118 TaxID=2851017 RepID=UPI001C2C9F3E|nr:hypothetical protein [Paracoccus sp. Z118]MBV0890445.1 hypothetical protein [Paracoccus sp. Z118]